VLCDWRWRSSYWLQCIRSGNSGGVDLGSGGGFETFSRHCLERYRWIHEVIVCTAVCRTRRQSCQRSPRVTLLHNSLFAKCNEWRRWLASCFNLSCQNLLRRLTKLWPAHAAYYKKLPRFPHFFLVTYSHTNSAVKRGNIWSKWVMARSVNVSSASH